MWNTIDELGLIVNSHSGMSSTSNRAIFSNGAPHPACALPLYIPENFFYAQNILCHLIWGGVFEKHPTVKFVFTELGYRSIHGAGAR